MAAEDVSIAAERDAPTPVGAALHPVLAVAPTSGQNFPSVPSTVAGTLLGTSFWNLRLTPPSF